MTKPSFSSKVSFSHLMRNGRMSSLSENNSEITFVKFAKVKTSLPFSLLHLLVLTLILLVPVLLLLLPLVVFFSFCSVAFFFLRLVLPFSPTK
jgi:hypothetical protein